MAPKVICLACTAEFRVPKEQAVLLGIIVGKGENARKHQSFSELDKLLVTAENHSGMSLQGTPHCARKADGIKCVSKLNGIGDVAKIVHKYEVSYWTVKWRM